jgi:hypothetical protein
LVPVSGGGCGERVLEGEHGQILWTHVYQWKNETC